MGYWKSFFFLNYNNFQKLIQLLFRLRKIYKLRETK